MNEKFDPWLFMGQPKQSFDDHPFRLLVTNSVGLLILRRRGEIVLREPKRNLGQAFAVLGAMPDDFMAEGRLDEAPQKRHAL